MRKVGDGTRALNFFIDTVIITVIAMLLIKWYNWYVMFWRYRPLNFGWFFFGTALVYYTLLEGIFCKTPGKWFTHSRVVTISGNRPNVGVILWRSLLRLTIIDLFFGPFLNGPLHDYASKTTVVED
ncbi:MAG TPA: RDD family protein [Sediminibacterium sp.]|nr:RDD family protein [Sediminibacterium sp.]